MTFDTARATLRSADMFQRFDVGTNAVRLDKAKISDDEQLLVIQRADERIALPVRQMAYHHVAQGELAGLPFLVTF